MPYFDHASTSYPKPNQVIERINAYLTDFGVSPGRGSYSMAQKAEEWIELARNKLGQVLNVNNAKRLAFTMNATHGLNIVIKGFVKPKDHVLICNYSHNAALRPLDRLKRELGIEYDIVPVNENGEVDIEEMYRLLRKNTSLFIATGASNVIGVKADHRKAFALCRSAGIKILFDGTQTFGYQEINWEKESIDFAVGTGHKTLLGPSGVGFLYVKDATLLPSFMEGGSHGNHSVAREHPESMPYKFEAGTINSVGIIGLLGSLEYILEKTFSAMTQKSLSFTEILWKELSDLDNIILYGSRKIAKKVPIISFNLKRVLPSQVASELDNKYKICVRAGLHCAPLMHHFLGTLPTGTVRISIGHQNSEEEIWGLINAIKKISLD